MFENVWTGTAGNNLWEDADNRSCGSVPDNNTDMVIFSGSVILNADVTIRSLTLSPGVYFTVAAGVSLIVRH